MRSNTKGKERFLMEPVLSLAEVFEMTVFGGNDNSSVTFVPPNAIPATELGDNLSNKKSIIDLFFPFGIFVLVSSDQIISFLNPFPILAVA